MEGSVLNIKTKKIKGIIPVKRIPVSLYEMNSREAAELFGNRCFIKRYRRIFFLAV
jgi:hypothetical protein